MVGRLLSLAALTLPMGCAVDGPVEEAELEPVMADADYLIRLSMDLRGTRPTVAEFDQLADDPAAIDGLIEQYLDDERFEARVRDLFSEIYRTRSEEYTVAADSYGLVDDAAFLEAVGEESLRVLSTIVAEDLPYTELVTGEWTMINEQLAAVWPTDYPVDGQGWQKARYTDGRPAAGVLTNNSMWWRYLSTASNANRARANAVSRIFLCHDYLSRPIHFDRNVNLLDEDLVLDALQTNPSCVNCHASLDPLAGYFFGFFYYDPYDPNEISSYHPERELLWRSYTEVEPAYYGEPSYNLWDLGQQIAGDNRFVECAVEQVYTGLMRRDEQLSDADRLTVHREAFLESGLTLRGLIASVVTDPRYKAGGTDAAGYVSQKMATPELMASQVNDLTGFDFSYLGYDLMRTDVVGYRTLAGGADGINVTESATGPNTTLLLVAERLAQSSAWYAAERDAVSDSPELFTLIDFTETPESNRDAMVAQLQWLHLRIFGERHPAGGEAIVANLELWSALYEVERSQVDAWAGVLSVLLRDPDFLFY